MRRTVMFVIVAVLGAMLLPTHGLGEPATSHGGTPSDVFTSETGGRCVRGAVHPPGAHVLPTVIAAGAQSNLLVTFTTNLQEVADREIGTLGFQLLDADGQVVDSMGDWNVPGGPGSVWVAGSTVWTFANVAPGDYTVQAVVSVIRLSEGGSAIQDKGSIVVTNCALTVIVTPVA